MNVTMEDLRTAQALAARLRKMGCDLWLADLPIDAGRLQVGVPDRLLRHRAWPGLLAQIDAHRDALILALFWDSEEGRKVREEVAR